MQTTWAGLPISEEPPFGATVVVYRVRDDRSEVLMLHRPHHGPAYTGDWAWTPPASARLPGEPAEDCGTDEWWVYLAEASPEAAVVIGGEHDRFEWLPVELARADCTPELARAPLLAAIA